VEGDFKVRVGMMTPSSVMDELEELVLAFEDEKFSSFCICRFRVETTKFSIGCAGSIPLGTSRKLWQIQRKFPQNDLGDRRYLRFFQERVRKLLNVP